MREIHAEIDVRSPSLARRAIRDTACRRTLRFARTDTGRATIPLEAEVNAIRPTVLGSLLHAKRICS